MELEKTKQRSQKHHGGQNETRKNEKMSHKQNGGQNRTQKNENNVAKTQRRPE